MIVQGFTASEEMEAGTANHWDGIKKLSNEVMKCFMTARSTANKRNIATLTIMSRSSVFAARNWLLIFPENPAGIRCEDKGKKNFMMERKSY